MTNNISLAPTIRLAILAGVLVLVSGALAALEVPRLAGRINDNADILSSQAEREMESYLAAVENTTGTQIALLTIPSLEGDSLESFSLRVVDEWALGSAEKDNGALLLVSMAERKIRIEVGYGLEETLTDAMSGYIIREAIVPEFKSGNFESGIIRGLNAMGGVVTGDQPISAEQIRQAESSGDEGIGVPFFFVVFVIIFILTRMGGYRRYRRRGMSPGSAFFMGMMLGGAGRSRGGRSGFSSGSGGFGGGGFSGGGGGFGGGGASGGW